MEELVDARVIAQHGRGWGVHEELDDGLVLQTALCEFGVGVGVKFSFDTLRSQFALPPFPSS